MGISYSGDTDDILKSSYLTGTVSVSTTEIEAKVNASPLTGRQLLVIQNKGSNPVYVGPTGVTSTTGFKIEKESYIAINVGDTISVFLICATSQSATVVVQEFS